MVALQSRLADSLQALALRTKKMEGWRTTTSDRDVGLEEGLCVFGGVGEVSGSGWGLCMEFSKEEGFLCGGGGRPVRGGGCE